MSEFCGLTREQKLLILGARIYELETRCPGAIDWDKLRRAEDIFWKIIENTSTENDWILFCEKNKIEKYLKLVVANNA
jgi:hypothetical protein